MKNKKGISPLIATVLILGFTVALAAVIMTWGTGFTKKMQTQTEETANVQVICATDVVFDVKSVCYEDEAVKCDPLTTDCYKILIQNDGKESIKKWKIRIYEDETKVDPLDSSVGIPAFGLAQIPVKPTTVTNVRKVEAIPIIQRAGADVVCSQNVDAFGDTSGEPIVTPCT